MADFQHSSPSLSRCFTCQYSLDHLLVLDVLPSQVDRATCPECGTPFDRTSFFLALKCVESPILSWSIRLFALLYLLVLINLPPICLTFAALIVLIPVYFLTRQLTTAQSVMLCFTATGARIYQLGNWSGETPYAYLLPLRLTPSYSFTRSHVNQWCCTLRFYNHTDCSALTTPTNEFLTSQLAEDLTPSYFASGKLLLTVDQATLLTNIVNQRIEHASKLGAREKPIVSTLPEPSLEPSPPIM